MTIYYVYAYLRKSDNSPYYIGKGQGNRAWTKHSSVSVPKDKTKIIILENNLTELGAFALERRMIRWYGRKDLGTGILINKTDGGEGASGYQMPQAIRNQISNSMIGVNKGRLLSNETRKKMSLAKQGSSRSQESIEKQKQSQQGRIISQETKNKIGAANKGRKYSAETCAKLSQQRKGRKLSAEAIAKRIQRNKLRRELKQQVHPID